MGRKDKFTVDYFLHKCNHGKTIFILENRFGNNGYAVWFKTLELLGASRNHFIDCRNTTDWEFMSAKMQVEPDKLQQIYDLLASLNTIDSELWLNKIVWSENFIDNLSDVYARRTNKCMNKSDLCKHLSIECKPKSSSPAISGNRKTTTVLNSTVLNSTLVNTAFEKFWNLYDYKKNRPDCELLWIGKNKTKQGNFITDELRTLIMNVLPKYVTNTYKDDRYPGRQHPKTYLYNECWNDEVIVTGRVVEEKKIYHWACPNCENDKGFETDMDDCLSYCDTCKEERVRK